MIRVLFIASLIIAAVSSGTEIRDQRAEFAQMTAQYRAHNAKPLDLAKMRTGEATELALWTSGTFYRPNQITVTTSAILETDMLVQTNGLNWHVPDGILYTTATNRTHYCLEVLSQYSAGSSQPNFWIYDWSCSVQHPCGSITGSDFVVGIRWSDLSCYLRPEFFANDTYQFAHYVNSSVRLQSGAWVNQAFLDNYCTGTRDLIYQHVFHPPTPMTCYQNECGWWGPLLETFCADCTGVSLKPLGYKNSQIAVNGKPFRKLDDAITSYGSPPWVLETHGLVNNFQWSAGRGANSLPVRPTALSAIVAPVGGIIYLAWQNNASNEEGFRIHRCLGSYGGCRVSEFQTIGTVGPNVTGFADLEANIAQRTYTYAVSAFNSTGASAFSNRVLVAQIASPHLESLNPNSGNTGTWLDLTGSGFQANEPDIFFGNMRISSRLFPILSPATGGLVGYRFLVPPRAPGVYPVWFTTSIGTSNTSPFTILTVPE